MRYVCDASRHLVCLPYSIAGLHRMAADLGIKPCWFHKDHYDIPEGRIAEITAKCEVVSSKEIVRIVNRRRKMADEVKPAEAPATPALLKFEDFTKVDMKVGNIVEAAAHPDPKVTKLVVLQVRVGDEMRQIVAGIKSFYEPANLVGKQIVVVTNLEPRNMRGVMSHGMLLAASDGSGSLSLLTTDKAIAAGSPVR
jgi:methionine--tRNA ligase beta chain